MNARFWKNIQNEGKITLDSFHLGQQFFAFKEFCMKKWLCNTFKTTNVTKLTKTILKSSY